MQASAMDINVYVHNGAVQLQGFVDVLAERSRPLIARLFHDYKTGYLLYYVLPEIRYDTISMKENIKYQNMVSAAKQS